MQPDAPPFPTKTGQQVASTLGCPNCGSSKIWKCKRYGQISYSCDGCQTWGPWRTAQRPKKSKLQIIAPVSP